MAGEGTIQISQVRGRFLLSREDSQKSPVKAQDDNVYEETSDDEMDSSEELPEYELTDPHYELEIDSAKINKMSIQELVRYKSQQAWCNYTATVRMNQQGRNNYIFLMNIRKIMIECGDRCWVCFRHLEVDGNVVATGCCPNKKIHLDCWEEVVKILIATQTGSDPENVGKFLCCGCLLVNNHSVLFLPAKKHPQIYKCYLILWERVMDKCAIDISNKYIYRFGAIAEWLLFVCWRPAGVVGSYKAEDLFELFVKCYRREGMNTPITMPLLYKLKNFNFVHEEIVVDRCKEGFAQCCPHYMHYGPKHTQEVGDLLEEFNSFSEEVPVNEYSMWARETQVSGFNEGVFIRGEVSINEGNEKRISLKRCANRGGDIDKMIGEVANIKLESSVRKMGDGTSQQMGEREETSVIDLTKDDEVEDNCIIMSEEEDVCIIDLVD